MEGFKCYDFEGDSRWTGRAGGDASSSGAGKDAEAKLMREKAAFYKKHVSPGFDMHDFDAWMEKEYPGKKTAAKPSASSASATTSVRGLLASGNLLFAGHLAIVVLSLCYVVPLMGFAFSIKCYRLALQAVIGTSLAKLGAKHGGPPIRGDGWTEKLDTLKRWFVPVQMSTDFHYLFMAMSVMSHPPLTICLAPCVCLAVYHVAVFLQQSPRVSGSAAWRKLGAPAFNSLRTNQKAALIFNASCEVIAFFQILARLFTRMRSVMLCFMFFNLLKMRYHSPDSQAYHRFVWQQVDAKFVQPYLLRFVPQAQKPISLIQAYFLKP